MEQNKALIIKEIAHGLESIGNFILGRRRPPWIKEKAEMDRQVRLSRQYYIWRSAVLRKDNYTCVKCGDDRKSVLEVDHIKPFSLFPELRFAIDNGRTLCSDCHKKTETYGTKVKKWKR